MSSSMRERIPADVLAVCRRLHGAGHEAHLVGGGVRDMLLGRVPADFDVVAVVAARLFEDRVEDVDRHARSDYKSRLQERAQALWQQAPVYEVVAEDGPDHDKRFEVALSLAGRPYGRAVGRSKKEAEQGAAAAALEALEREAKP